MADWYLNITEKEFDKLYGNKVDKAIFLREPESDEDLIENFLPSKLWRLNNLYYIVDKQGNLIGFKMNKSQHVVYRASLDHPRIVILKSRQQGISTLWLIYGYDEAIFKLHLNIGLMAQGKDEAGTLLDRVKLARDNLNPAIIAFLDLLVKKDNADEIQYNTGSTIFIRTSFRSATLQMLHISEYGKICAENPKRAKETKSGTLQAIAPGNIVVIESTAEGNNDFKKMWDDAIERKTKIKQGVLPGYAGKDYQPVFLSWLYDPDCNSDYYEQPTEEQEKYFEKLETQTGEILTETQRNFWITQYRELGDMIYQEYPATPEEAFQKINDGTYYSTLYTHYVVGKKREIRGLYDSNLEVNVAMDLGIDEDDLFTLIYFQRYGQEWRLIRDYQSYGMGLEHYVNHMRETGYYINAVVCPHDIKVRELGSGINAKSREQSLRELGVSNIITVDKTSSVAKDIELVRQYLKHMYVDPTTCGYTIKCLKNYSREWDERANTWARKPKHNEWSHGADAVRCMFLSGINRMPSIRERERERRAYIANGIAM